jgi:uncharacterized protein (DUF983 family)
MIASILKMKCPKCHVGNIFVNNNHFKLSTLSHINKTCSCCGQPFEPEPGFYFGAMYVSYGLGVVYFLLSFLIFDYLLHFPGWLFLGIYIISLLILWPIVFRISRVMYLNLFVRYDKHACNMADSSIKR